jgi:hypothetical protein
MTVQFLPTDAYHSRAKDTFVTIWMINASGDEVTVPTVTNAKKDGG